MSVRTELIAAVIRALSGKTTLIRQPEPFEEFLTTLFGGETYDRRLARNIELETQRAADAVKRVHTRHIQKKTNTTYPYDPKA